MKTKKISFDKFDILVFIVLICPLFFYFFIYYPAIFSFDSYNQLGQIISMKFTLGHPFIHTFIEFICLKIWNNPASIALLQIFIFDMTWVIICKYNRKKNTKFEKLLQILFSIILGIHPLVGTYTITLWKDILYSIVVLQICFVFEIFIDKKFKLNTLYILIMSFLLILAKNLRYNGLIITVVFSIIIVIILFIYDRKQKNYIKFIIFMVVFNFLLSVPQNFFNIEKSSSLVSSSMFNGKMIHAFGAYSNSGVLQKDEYDELSKYLNVEQLSLNYNPYFMDPIGNVEVDNEKITKEFGNFTKLFIKTSFKHPKTTIHFWTKSTAIIWRLSMTSDEVGSSIYTSTYAQNKIEYYNHVNENTKLYKFVNKTIYKFENNKFLNIILYRPAFYLYLTFALLIMLFIKKIKSALFIIIPNILNLIGLIISIPVQDVRYVYANYLVFFLILITFIDRYTVYKK